MQNTDSDGVISWRSFNPEEVGIGVEVTRKGLTKPVKKIFVP
jgi:hypothetical protein